MDVLDKCGWKSCRQESDAIFYGIAGLCDKHIELWYTLPEAFAGTKLSVKAFLKKCSPEVRAYHKSIKK